MKVSENHQAYWRKNLRITSVLLAIWFVVTYVMAFFARDLSFNFFGWPFSFYMAAQGSLVIYVAIIWFLSLIHIFQRFDEGAEHVQHQRLAAVARQDGAHLVVNQGDEDDGALAFTFGQPVDLAHDLVRLVDRVDELSLIHI